MGLCGEWQEADPDTSGDIKDKEETMELRIATQMDPGILPEIQWNHEDLKKEIAAKAAEYKAIAYTDEQESEMRKDRATLNKLVTAFEDQRKQVKKFYQAPYDKFEAQVKEVLQPVREAIKTIDAGLSEIDRDYRLKKTNKMRELYEASVGDLKGILPFEKTIREEWYKKSITDKKLEQGYTDLFGRIRSDLESLEELPERFRDKATLRYMETYSLSDALREGKRLEEVERAMEDRCRKQEEEAARKSEMKKEEKKAETSVSCTTPQETVEQNASAEDPVMCLDFRVWGTREQLMALRQYMIDNHLKFGKVE